MRWLKSSFRTTKTLQNFFIPKFTIPWQSIATIQNAAKKRKNVQLVGEKIIPKKLFNIEKNSMKIMREKRERIYCLSIYDFHASQNKQVNRE